MRLVTKEAEEAGLSGTAAAQLNSASCAGRTRSCAAPEPVSSSAAVLPPPAPAPCSPGPGCCPPAGASPMKHKQAQRASEVIKFKDSPAGATANERFNQSPLSPLRCAAAGCTGRVCESEDPPAAGRACTAAEPRRLTGR